MEVEIAVSLYMLLVFALLVIVTAVFNGNNIFVNFDIKMTLLCNRGNVTVSRM